MPDADSRIIANVERLHAAMDRHRLAAVVARSGQNVTYLAGFAYPGTLARHLDLTDSTRGVLLVWPRHGEPVIVLNKIAEGLAGRDSWVKRTEVYDAYTESPYAREGEGAISMPSPPPGERDRVRGSARRGMRIHE